MSDFHRVRRLPPYVFEQVNKLKAKARAGGADIVDLGMGNPDLPAPKHVIDKLVETVGKPRSDRYSASKASLACAARKPAITRAASGSSSTPRRRWSRPSARRKASPTWPRRSPRRAMSYWSRTLPIRSTPSAS